jgi:hypothetical protein
MAGMITFCCVFLASNFAIGQSYNLIRDDAGGYVNANNFYFNNERFGLQTSTPNARFELSHNYSLNPISTPSLAAFRITYRQPGCAQVGCNDSAVFSIQENVLGLKETRFVINPDGKLGINTTSPSSFLTINSNSSNQNLFSIVNENFATTYFRFGTTTSEFNGNIGLNTNTPLANLHINQNGNRALLFESNNAEPIEITREINTIDRKSKFGLSHSGGEVGLRFQMWNTTNNEWLSRAFFIEESGRIGVGTTAPQAGLHIKNTYPTNGIIYEDPNGEVQFKVYENGELYCRRVVVTAQPIPDYVFKSDYNRMSLKELEAYINANHHLPGIKSEKEVEEDGTIDMTELQLKLLEKVEELTLYMIELQKQNELLQNKIQQLENK